MNIRKGFTLLSFAVALSAVGLARGEVSRSAIPDHPEWGYQISGLGDAGNETAFVFTNTASAMSLRLPGNVKSIRYLVVGGGGAGGACAASSYTSGGGGGAGAALAGTISTAGGETLTVRVGTGGTGCGRSGNNLLAPRMTNGNGGYSSLYVGESQQIKALGGGFGGCNGNSASNADKIVGSGGCGGGGCGKRASGSGSAGGNSGGQSVQLATNVYPGGGGGGAGAPGQDCYTNDSGKYCGGNGGDGIESDITGDSHWYAGGGGAGAKNVAGSGGKGGGGKGASATTTSTASMSATYYGGGGGGSFNNYTASAPGAGYQGIVVVRYAVESGLVMVPDIQSKVYTGTTLTADISDTDTYTVTANAGGIDVGEYDVTLTLADGYHWDGDSAVPTNLVFAITPAQNEWTTDLAISKATWLTTGEPATLTPAATAFGTPLATISKDGGEAAPFDGMLPEVAGEYVVTYTAPTSANWTDPSVTTQSVEFEIVSADVVPPFSVALGTIAFAVVQNQVDMSLPYAISCDVTSDKTIDIYARYAMASDMATTNEVKLAGGVALDATGTCTIRDVQPGMTYYVSLYGKGGDTMSEATSVQQVEVVGPANGLSASATFTNDPMEFVIAGSVTPGLGVTTVHVRWSINSSDLDQGDTHTFQYGDAGAFTNRIEYTSPCDQLTWDVTVSNAFATATYGQQSWDDALPTATRSRNDKTDTVYTWTGAGEDNSWTNFNNWASSRAMCFGFPDNANYATAKFTNNAAVNLCGASFDLRKETGLTVSAGSYSVVLSNGTINAEYAKDRDFGAKGTTIVFKDATLVRTRLGPVEGAKVVFEGTSTLRGMLRPFNTTDIVTTFRDGKQTVTGIIQGSAHSGNVINIENAALTVQGNLNATWYMTPLPIVFANGNDRQARLISTGNTGWNFNQASFSLAIPATPYATAYLQAKQHYSQIANQAVNVKIDVTGWKGARKIPLISFTSATEQTSFEALPKTLKATAVKNGQTVDVTAKRNARLVWDGESNTLYYKQDSQDGFALILY